MTLQVDDHCLPLIRYPNFADLTWDVPIDKVSVTVGNEVLFRHLRPFFLFCFGIFFCCTIVLSLYFSSDNSQTGSNPYSVSLREYLEHFRMYLHNPARFALILLSLSL
jgi:uncharacterized membrane protein